MFSMLYVHITAVIPGVIVSVLLMSLTSRYKAISTVFSLIMGVIYFSVIFAKAHHDGHHDRMPHNRESGHILKGFLISLGILGLNFILWLGYWFTWKFLTIDGSIATVTGFIYNLLFYFDTIFFTELGEIQLGNINLLGNLLIYLVPLFASGLGYILGFKGISPEMKLNKIMYEEKKD